MSKKIDKGTMHSIITCSVIDFLINEILEEGNKEYESLSYMKKTGLCKLIQKKGRLYGRVLA